MSDIDAIRQRLVDDDNTITQAEDDIAILLAEVDFLNTALVAIEAQLDDEINGRITLTNDLVRLKDDCAHFTDLSAHHLASLERSHRRVGELLRLGNALSDAVGSYAHTQAVEDARKAWDDEVGR